LTYGEAAEILTAASDRPIRYVSTDDAGFVRGAVAAGLPEEYGTMMASLFGAVRAGAAARVDPSLPDLIGRPARTLADYAKDHAAIWRR
jgi:uncharacterized protein YbjT (DUF2867 family)